MNLKEISKSIFIKKVLKHKHSNMNWRVLVIHEETANILTNIFKFSELLSHELISIQRLDDQARRPVPDHPAIYFISPNDTSINQIVKDHKSKMYSRFSVFLTRNLTSKQEKILKKVKEPEIEYKCVHLGFACFDTNVFFCDLENIKGLAEAVDHNFYVSHVSQLDKEDADNIENKFKEDGRSRKGNLIIFNRACDLITPLIRFFSFQAVLNDFNIIENTYFKEKGIFFEENNLWHDIKYMHIAEINPVLAKQASALNKNIQQIQNAGTKDLIKMVLEAPEQIQLKEEVGIYLEILDRCITKFENENLSFVSLTEQNIISKKDPAGVKYQNGITDFFKIGNDEKVNKEDKLRMYLLLSVMGYDFQKTEDMHLINNGILDKKDVLLRQKIEKIRQENIFIKQNRSKYDISRYKPVLETLIREFEGKRKIFNFQGTSEEKKDEMLSLRQSKFIFQKHQRDKKLVCVYVKNGITFEEIKIINILEMELGIDLILGSSEVLSYKKFFENIEKLKL